MGGSRWKVRGVRECSRIGCSRLFEYTWVTEKETECVPHRRATSRMKNAPTTVVRVKRVNTLLEHAPAYTDEQARELMGKLRLVPTVPYLGFREAWPSRCLYCRAAHHPTLEQIQAHIDNGAKRFCWCRGKQERYNK